MSDYKSLKSECNRETFRNTLKEKLGIKCANCGCSGYVEYHHIVPLALVGTNNITNFAPLCNTCHKLAHGSVNIRETFRPEKTGRPKRSAPKDHEKILWRYINGEIGMSECKKLLNLSKSIKMQDVWYYKEFLEKNNILRHKNKIDILQNKNHCVPSGKSVAVIEFSNGKIVTKYAI